MTPQEYENKLIEISEKADAIALAYNTAIEKSKTESVKNLLTEHKGMAQQDFRRELDELHHAFSGIEREE